MYFQYYINIGTLMNENIKEYIKTNLEISKLKFEFHKLDPKFEKNNYYQVGDNKIYYSTLEEVNKVIEPLCKKIGLIITQELKESGIITTFSDTKGNSESYTFVVPNNSETKAQEDEELITTCKVLALSGLLNLEVGYDSNGL